jgi:ferrous iron transport protein B
MIPAFKTRERVRQIVITGNPNSGKTTLFNALTGLRQKVGNYPGVTVERKEGHLSFDDGSEAILVDLPGTYSLTPNSPDEKVTTDILLGKLKDGSLPDLVICILDASNIERHLYLATQIIDSQIPVVLALNMIDTAEAAGVKIDTTRLERSLGVRVVPTIGTKGIGIAGLKHAIAEKHPGRLPSRSLNLPKVVEEELDELIGLLKQYRGIPPPAALHEAVDLLSSNNGHSTGHGPLSQEILDHVRKDRERLDFLEIDRPSVFVESRYAWIKRSCQDAITRPPEGGISFSDKLDRVLVHRVWGYVIFLTLMGVMFLSVFSWSAIPMEWIGGGF